jgi:hypothetical protein
METITTPKVQINGQIRTNAKNEIIEKSLLLNIREDNLFEAIKLFNQLHTRVSSGDNFFAAPLQSGQAEGIPMIEQEPKEYSWPFETNDPAPACPLCNSRMVKRSGKNGEFFGCIKYSRGCKGTRQV